MATDKHEEDCTCNKCYLEWRENWGARRPEALFCLALLRTLDALSIAKVTKEYNRLRDDKDEADKLLNQAGWDG